MLQQNQADLPDISYHGYKSISSDNEITFIKLANFLYSSSSSFTKKF